MNDFYTGLCVGLEKLGIPGDDEQIAKLERFACLLEKWNKVYNLTAIRCRE